MENRPWIRHYDYNVPTTIRYPRLTAPQMLMLPANTFPDKAATDFFGTKITFYQLRLLVNRMANALGALGVKKGDRVGIHLPTSPQYVISFFATMSLGAIAVNLNPMYTREELSTQTGTTGVSTLITFDMVLDNIRPAVQAGGIERVIVTRVTDFVEGFGVSTAKDLELEEGWHHFSELFEGCSDTKNPRVAVTPEDPAMIQFTGGTTGIPKGAVLTHANIIAATMMVSLWGSPTIGLIPPERRCVLAVLPYFHVYGLIVSNMWSVMNCGTQILVPRFDLDEFMGILGSHEDITFFPTVPTMINAIINHPQAEGLNLGKRLGLLNSGAAPIPVEMIDQLLDNGIYFSEGWGMSETTSVGIANPIFGMKKPGGIGIPFPDMEIKLVDVDNPEVEVPQGMPGEILVKGPVVMKEYWNNPEETAGQLKDGWLHTGDVAIQDEDDYFFIVDRKKDMIIAGGYNIYPREIDEVLFQHPKVQDVITIGVSDQYRGETVKAFVVPVPGQSVTEEEIISFAKEKLAAYKTPKMVEFREELPKSAVGKTLRKILRAEEEAKNKE